MTPRWVVIALLLCSLPLQARIEALQFEDARQEQRYRNLIAELRCLVCQNQNLADSNAELAQDLRQQTYEMIRKGASDDEIVDYMVKRYGDFVLYRPPVKTNTALLWIGPFVLLGAGLVTLIVFARRRGRAAAATLDDAERERVRRLLDDEKESVS
jgi:cytochrome c-type biogenesis protein CcmH